MHYKKLISLLTLFLANSLFSQITLNIKDETSLSNLNSVNVINYEKNYGSFSDEKGKLVIPKGVYGKFLITIVGYDSIITTISKDTSLEILLKRKYVKDSVVKVIAHNYGKIKKIGDIKGTVFNSPKTPFVGKYEFADYLQIEPNRMGRLEKLKFKFLNTKFDYNNGLVEINLYGINAEETFMEKLNEEPIFYQLKNNNSVINVDISQLRLTLNTTNLLITYKILHNTFDTTKRVYLLLHRTTEKPFPTIVCNNIKLSPIYLYNNCKVKTELTIKTFKK
jgi:hypothetical protein